MTLKKLYEQIESVKRMRDVQKPHSHRRRQLQVRVEDMMTKILEMEARRDRRKAA
ncbi:MAG: hypothetical protein JWL86_2809 [Rhizobium sp.]|nr:hypothetical protein [Rhizobium sp.]